MLRLRPRDKSGSLKGGPALLVPVEDHVVASVHL